MASRDDPLELDLTDEIVPPGGPPQPRQQAYSPAKSRELIRGLIALTVIGLLALMALGTLIIAAFIDTSHWDQFSKALGLIVSPVFGLAGAVMGFYYGERAGRFE